MNNKFFNKRKILFKNHIKSFIFFISIISFSTLFIFIYSCLKTKDQFKKDPGFVQATPVQTNDLSNNIGLYHKNVLEDYESGNGDYDFYYGDIDISVNDVFGSVSIYCYNHGYMGGKYKLLYI